ncbi:MAG: glutathione S-transferase family protein [Caulobacteraceae bacterium]
MGKVPAIKHGDVVVTEAAAICAYLADAFPQADLAPPTSDKRRGTYYRWLFFGAGPIEQANQRPVARRGYQARAEADDGLRRHDRHAEAMEGAVTGRDYLLGDTFSAADAYFGSQINFGLQFGSIEKRPAFVAYSERLQARPAYKRASEIDGQGDGGGVLGCWI